MDIKKIAEEISQDELNELKVLLGDKRSNAIRDKIKAQLPDLDKIYSALSEKQYFDQTIEIDTMLKVKFRTMTDSSKQEVNDFVSKNETSDNVRLYNRKRLSYGLIEINGKSLSGGEAINGSYWDMALSGLNVNDELKKLSDKRLSILNVLDSTMVDKILVFYNSWEFLVYDSINNMDLSVSEKN